MQIERHSVLEAETRTREAHPAVYVLLLNWKGWQDTVECLESVFRQSYPNYRVVVCDNASPNDSLDQIRAWAAGDSPPALASEYLLSHLTSPPVAKPIRVAQYDREAAEAGGDPQGRETPLVLIQTGANLGFAGGNNVGIRYISQQPEARYIWLLNTDTVVDPHALRNMVDLAELDVRTGMVGCKLLDYRQQDRIQAAGGGAVVPWQGLTHHIGGDEVDAGQWNEVFEPDYITGASLLVRMEVVRTVGEMDESYFLYSEEVDWCLRTRQKGWRLLYSPSSSVWHKGGQTVGYGTSFHDYYTVRSMLLLVRKFYPSLLPLTFAYSVYRCLAPKVVRLQYGRLRAVLRAYRDFALGESRR